MQEYTRDECIDLTNLFDDQPSELALSDAPEEVQGYVCWLIDEHASGLEEREELLAMTLGELAEFVHRFETLESYEELYDLDEDFWDSYDPM